jgi:hypothetical protein
MTARIIRHEEEILRNIARELPLASPARTRIFVLILERLVLISKQSFNTLCLHTAPDSQRILKRLLSMR